MPSNSTNTRRDSLEIHPTSRQNTLVDFIFMINTRMPGDSCRHANRGSVVVSLVHKSYVKSAERY